MLLGPVQESLNMKKGTGWGWVRNLHAMLLFISEKRWGTRQRKMRYI